MMFRFSAQLGRAHTRKKKTLQGSLVTFLTNELGTEGPYSGIIREDLREGRCKEGTECHQGKDMHNAELWGSPLGTFLHLYMVRNMQPIMLTLDSTTQVKGNLVTRAQ